MTEDIEKSIVAIKDQLGKPPEHLTVGVWEYFEDISIDELSTVVKLNSLGSSFILGHPTNGVLGTSALGESGRVLTTYTITNPNLVFRERFHDDYFKDSTATNTSDWNTTIKRLRMSSSSNHASIYNTITTSSSIAYNDGIITSATFNANENKWNAGDQIIYFLSADGGTTWEEIQNNTVHTFTVTGTDLRFKIVFIGNGGTETYIDYVRIEYSS